MTPKRVLRHDSHVITNAEASAWLKTYGHIIEIELRQMKRGMRKSRWHDEEDLRSIGRYAVLEACSTYRVENAGGATLRTWVGRIVNWRMRAAAAESLEVDGRARAATGLLPEWATEQIVEPSSSDDLFALTQRISELIAALDVTDRHILMEHLAGESAKHIGSQIGLTGYQVRQRIRTMEENMRAEIEKSPVADLEAGLDLGADGKSLRFMVAGSVPVAE